MEREVGRCTLEKRPGRVCRFSKEESGTRGMGSLLYCRESGENDEFGRQSETRVSIWALCGRRSRGRTVQAREKEQGAATADAGVGGATGEGWRGGDTRGIARGDLACGHVCGFRAQLEYGDQEVAESAGRQCGPAEVHRDVAAPGIPVSGGSGGSRGSAAGGDEKREFPGGKDVCVGGGRGRGVRGRARG